MNNSRQKVVVLGTGPVAAATFAALSKRPDVDVHRGDDALSGAALVVLEEGGAPRKLAQRAPACVVIVAGGAGAVDAAAAATVFPRARILGAAAVEASARAAAAVAAAAGVAPRDVVAPVLGGDGVDVVAALSLTTIGGAPAAAVLGAERLAEIVAAALVGPVDDLAMADAVTEVAGAVLDDARRVLPCAVGCHGEYGIGGAAVAVPCVVGAAGVERILEVPLADDERERLGRAAAV